MRSSRSLAALLLTACLGLIACRTEQIAISPTPGATSPETRALTFLAREVPAWSRDNGCFSCHNNGDAARALYAGLRSQSIPGAALADTTRWLMQPERWDHNKGEPGFSDQRLARIQFAAALATAVDAGKVGSITPLVAATRLVAADQGADGAWRIGPQDSLGSPATYGTHLATVMALSTLERTQANEFKPPIRRARAWLHQAPINNVLAAAAWLLALGTSTDPALLQQGQACRDLIRRSQTADGGWGPYADSPPEPFDTALVLLALSAIRAEAGVAPLVQRGRAFLISTQLLDGSWPETTRPPGGRSYAQRLSTTGWATLALLESRDVKRNP